MGPGTYMVLQFLLFSSFGTLWGWGLFFVFVCLLLVIGYLGDVVYNKECSFGYSQTIFIGWIPAITGDDDQAMMS